MELINKLETATTDRETGNVNIVSLRNVEEEDLSVLFEQQLDPAANHMAAFTHKDPADRNAFNAHWHRMLADPTVITRTVLAHDQVAGYVASWVDLDWLGKPEVTYWVGRQYWGKGVATKALTLFLTQQATRPIYGRAAKDNLASLRVLQKCGFRIIGYGKGFANARNAELEEAHLILE